MKRNAIKFTALLLSLLFLCSCNGVTTNTAPPTEEPTTEDTPSPVEVVVGINLIDGKYYLRLPFEFPEKEENDEFRVSALGAKTWEELKQKIKNADYTEGEIYRLRELAQPVTDAAGNDLGIMVHMFNMDLIDRLQIKLSGEIYELSSITWYGPMLQCSKSGYDNFILYINTFDVQIRDHYGEQLTVENFGEITSYPAGTTEVILNGHTAFKTPENEYFYHYIFDGREHYVKVSAKRGKWRTTQSTYCDGTIVAREFTICSDTENIEEKSFSDLQVSIKK